MIKLVYAVSRPLRKSGNVGMYIPTIKKFVQLTKHVLDEVFVAFGKRFGITRFSGKPKNFKKHVLRLIRVLRL